MKTAKTLMLSLGAIAMLSACSTKVDTTPTGSWTTAAPENVTQSVVDATSATRTLTFDFAAPDVLTFTADYAVTTADTISYKVTASIKGTWVPEDKEKDNDDYLLAFDTNTLSVQGTDAPELGPVTDAFLSSLSSYTTIDDVEISKDGSHMTFETKAPKTKYHLIRK